VWQSTGMAAVCAEEDVPLISLEQAGVRSFEIDGFAFTVAVPVLEADLIVNLPKVKSHSLTMLTAAVKNIYGVVPGYSKTTLHRLHPKPDTFGRLIRTIWQVIPPTWTLADGVVGMEGQGPANGRPVALGFLAASADPFALDHALCDVLHIDVRRVPYLAPPLADDAGPAYALAGDPISVAAFEVPSGAHLLKLLPDWLVKRASRIVWVRPAFSAEACIGCGKCERACPVQAIALSPQTHKPLLSPLRCISCSCCHEVCPKDAVRMTQSRLLRLMKVFKGID
jgi:ferredoxin